MRFVFAATAAVSLSACFGAPDELLEPTRGDGRASGEAQHGFLVQGDALRLDPQALAPEVRDSQGPAEPEVPSFEQAVLDELALTVDYASVQALAVADAGFAYDRASAELAAIELANAAALVSQRAHEMQALSNVGDCGCECEPAGEGSEIPGVEEAAVFSALAAEFGGEIVDGLNPPSEMVCGDGCGATCEEIPGTVDDVVLAQAIEGALDAAEGCAAAGELLGAL